MSSESEKHADKQPAAPAETASGSARTATDKPPKKPPETLEERLLNLDAKSSKKALHDSRVLKRLGVVFIALGVCALLLEPLFIALPRLPNYASWDFRFREFVWNWRTFVLPLAIVGAPALGVALRKCRSNLAQWIFRVIAILAIIESALDMIDLGRNIAFAFREARPQGVMAAVGAAFGHPFFGGFIGELVSLLISVRLVIITYNDVLFGPNPPSHNQLGYVRSKWKAGEKPDHIPEHVHKPMKHARLCLGLASLMILVYGFQTYRNLSKHIEYTHAEENFEKGQTLFAEAGQTVDPRIADEKYREAYLCFRKADRDPVIRRNVQRYLGLQDARGLGCKRNSWLAFRELVAFLGDPVADPETIRTCLDSEAQYELALLYLYGRGTNQNVPVAAELLKSAAKNGLREARALLGYDVGGLDENGSETGDDENPVKEPDYGGRTVEEYLKEKIERESMKTPPSSPEPPAESPARR